MSSKKSTMGMINFFVFVPAYVVSDAIESASF